MGLLELLIHTPVQRASCVGVATHDAALSREALDDYLTQDDRTLDGYPFGERCRSTVFRLTPIVFAMASTVCSLESYISRATRAFSGVIFEGRPPTRPRPLSATLLSTRTG
jgi:hypothetical protein